MRRVGEIRPKMHDGMAKHFTPNLIKKSGPFLIIVKAVPVLHNELTFLMDFGVIFFGEIEPRKHNEVEMQWRNIYLSKVDLKR